ncbi:signal peptidase I [Lachnospiraceae bacterium RM5]|nr:signal peptidase I [Lachnospiraceae bacterium RM5]
MQNDIEEDDGIEIIYWGDEEKNTVNEENFKRKKRDRFNLKKELRAWGKLILIALIIALCINYFVITNSVVPSGSMQKTIKPKSRMIGYRLAYTFSSPKRGDIIIFKYPDDEKQTFVKRVIGLPGETVKIERGKVYINGKELKEDYVYFDTGHPEEGTDFEEITVPENGYFVLGDNRNNSEDSRYWQTTNFVSENKIIGKALFCYYPEWYLIK